MMEGFELLRQLGLAVGQNVFVVEEELSESALYLKGWGAEIVGNAVRIYGEVPEATLEVLSQGFLLSIGADPEGPYDRYIMVWRKRGVSRWS